MQEQHQCLVEVVVASVGVVFCEEGLEMRDQLVLLQQEQVEVEQDSMHVFLQLELQAKPSANRYSVHKTSVPEIRTARKFENVDQIDLEPK